MSSAKLHRDQTRGHLKTTLYSGWAAMPKSYGDVFQSGVRSSFFLSKDWFLNFAQHVVSDTQLRIYGVETEAGEAVATLPLFQATPPQTILAPKTLESLSNYYTCDFAPVIRDGANVDDVVRAVSKRLWQDRRQWDVLKLQPLERDSTIYTALVNGLRDAGLVVQTYFSFGNWYLDVAGRSYQQYVDSLSSMLRKNIPYNIRRLERLENTRIVIHTDEVGLDRAVDDYETVYNSSWKISEATPQFIRGLAHLAARNGWLRLGLVYIDDVAAAAQLWIVYDGVASIYKIAYDERFAKLSVGTVLTAKLMQRVIDVDKVKIVDYLSGEDDYKRNWMSHRREFWGIAAFNPRSLCGLGQIARHVGGKAAKRTLERVAGPALEKLRRRKNAVHASALTETSKAGPIKVS